MIKDVLLLVFVVVQMIFIYLVLRKHQDFALIVVKEWSKARTIFTMMFYAVFLYCILRHIPIPPELNTIISTLFGFWFGQKQSVKKEGEQK